MILKAALMAAEDVLEELEIPVEEEPSATEIAAQDAGSWMRYNVAMTGRVPLLDEQQGKD